MNKENVVAKINKYGKIGKIITTVLMVVAILGAVATLVAGITLICIPQDFIVFNLDNKATVTIDASAVTPGMTEADEEMIEKAFNSGAPTGFNLGAVRFALDKAEVIDGKLVASSTGNEANISLKNLGLALLAVVVALVLTVVSLVFGRRLCKAFEICETPFEEDVITKMKQFAIALLPWAVYSSVPVSIMNSVLNNSLKMNLNLDLNIIFAVLVIWALSTVFSYGAELQRESDETL